MGSHGIFRVPDPYNEPVKGYEPGSPERDELRRRLDEMSGERLDIPLVIGGEEVRTGDTFESVMPHKRSHILGDTVSSTVRYAAGRWRASYDHRARRR